MLSGHKIAACYFQNVVMKKTYADPIHSADVTMPITLSTTINIR